MSTRKIPPFLAGSFGMLLDYKDDKVLIGHSSRSSLKMNVTAWSKGLEVMGGGTGVVNIHASAAA